MRKSLTVLACLAGALVAARAAHADCHSEKLPNGYRCWSVATSKIAPGQTYDGSLSDPKGNSDENYVYAPDDPARGTKLLLFLPGNNGPVGLHRDYYAAAAKRGFYVIALAYRNQVHTPDLCGFWPDCYGKLYAQQVDGHDNGFFGHDAQAGYVPAYNSITYRFGVVLAAMLKDHGDVVDWNVFWNYGAAYAPDPGYWYNGAPAWSHIVISGHSQGGEVATWITKNKNVIAGLVFAAPYATLDNNHKSDDVEDTTTNGPPHHMEQFLSLVPPPAHLVWVDVTAWYTPYPLAGGVANDHAYATYLDPSTWPAHRIDRLFITANSFDGIYNPLNGAAPGHNVKGASMNLGKIPTEHVNSCPATLGTGFNVSDWDPANGSADGCDGHHSMINDNCTPIWIKCYWFLLFDAALAL
ncbi:MAG: hypothetical protein K8W52_11725 [Deltaproteobacteria bacterium]|nr:hypothetical protein [Deltaproteobacteria bacterium]